jgi:hypothetical protein
MDKYAKFSHKAKMLIDEHQGTVKTAKHTNSEKDLTANSTAASFNNINSALPSSKLSMLFHQQDSSRHLKQPRSPDKKNLKPLDYSISNLTKTKSIMPNEYKNYMKHTKNS